MFFVKKLLFLEVPTVADLAFPRREDTDLKSGDTSQLFRAKFPKNCLKMNKN